MPTTRATTRKVTNLRHAPVAQQHVGRLDVAVDDGTVQERQRGTYVRGDAPEGFAEPRQRLRVAEARPHVALRRPVQHPMERAVRGELEDRPEQALVVVGQGAEQRDDVGVPQSP